MYHGCHLWQRKYESLNMTILSVNFFGPCINNTNSFFQIGDNSQENDFVKQYLANQRKMLQKQQHRCEL